MADGTPKKIPDFDPPDKVTSKLHRARVQDMAARTGLSKPLIESVLGAWRDACRKFRRNVVSAEKMQERISREESEHPWALFLGAHWTKFRPRVAGWYLLADLEGAFRRVEYIDPAAPLTFVEPWRGWYWNRPIPGLPRPIPGREE